MRMWMVRPSLLCRQHLLGEHKELHMIIGAMEAKRSLAGHIMGRQLDLSRIATRHEALVREMERRGWKGHKTPVNVWKFWRTLAHWCKAFPAEAMMARELPADERENLRVLYNRCAECRKLLERLDDPGFPSPGVHDRPEVALAVSRVSV